MLSLLSLAYRGASCRGLASSTSDPSSGCEMSAPMLQLGVGGPTVCRNAAHDTPNQDGGGGPCGHCDGEQLRLRLGLRLPRENSTPSPADGIPVKQPRPRPLERELVPLHSLIKE